MESAAAVGQAIAGALNPGLIRFVCAEFQSQRPQQSGHSLHLRDVNPLPEPGVRSLDQGQQNCLGPGHATHCVAVGTGRATGSCVWEASQVGETRPGLQCLAVTDAVFPWAGAPKTRHAEHDDVWFYLPDTFVVQPPTRHHSATEILSHNVRYCHQPSGQVLPCIGLHVQ